MTAPVDAITDRDELRAFVHQTLCEKENLVPEQFRMIERQLTRSGKGCGLQFTIHGPRQVRLSAVWASDRNTLYFYDATGTRYLKVQLRAHIAVESSEQAA